MSFTKQELDVLFDAVEAWENGDGSGEIMGAVMEGMFSSHMKPEDKQKMVNERNERRLQAQEDRRRRKERGVMIRAKLIQMRDSIHADDLVRSAQS